MSNSKNPGKIFEREFKKSADNEELLCVRFNDSDMSYHKNKELRSRFTPDNPADFLIYRYQHIYFIECKSTHSKSISFQTDPEEKTGMIKLHQIRDLAKMSMFEGVRAYFLFNFRTEEDGVPYSEKTYAMSIKDFSRFFAQTDRKSITESLITQYGGFEIDAVQKRKLYTYKVSDMLYKIEEKEKKKEKENLKEEENIKQTRKED